MIYLLYFIIFFPGIQNLLDQHTLLEELIDPHKEDRYQSMETAAEKLSIIVWKYLAIASSVTLVS